MMDADRARACKTAGDEWRASGSLARATRAYQDGLQHAPSDIGLSLALAGALLAQGDKQGARDAYRAAITVDPGHFEARIRLAHVLKLNAEYAAASEVLNGLLLDHPNDAQVQKEFGRLHFAQQHLAQALASFQRVVELTPNDADAHHWLANIQNTLGNAPAALVHYRRTLALQPLMRVPSVRSPAAFSVLFLFAPGNANTPPDTLVKGADYDSCFLLLLPDVTYDAERLRRSANLLVNLVSDVDHARDILPQAVSLVDRIGLPVINHPRMIARTDRESVATRLTGIPDCRIPRVFRSGAEHVAQDIEHNALTFPLLIRVAGTHGGEHFERADDLVAVADFRARHPAENLYLTQYADYQSADGFFRKYRFFFVGDGVLPYHLAIDAEWKVHHVTTDMANQPWMQHEEAAFLDNPGCVFEPRHFSALQAIRKAIGLDFFGIDCAIDRDGRLVVFEVNASMLVHQNYGPFTYKAKAVNDIKRAFHQMLRVRSGSDYKLT